MVSAIHAKTGGYAFIRVIGSFAGITSLSVGQSFVYLPFL